MAASPGPPSFSILRRGRQEHTQLTVPGGVALVLFTSCFEDPAVTVALPFSAAHVPWMGGGGIQVENVAAGAVKAPRSQEVKQGTTQHKGSCRPPPL